MNILISHFADNSLIIRPDSTLVRTIDRYFVPDGVAGITFSPVAVFKVNRAGKSISSRFAKRYIDSFSFGILIHPVLTTEDDSNNLFIVNSFDFTTIVPLQLSPVSEYFEKEKTSLRFMIDNVDLHLDLHFPSQKEIYDRIEYFTHYGSVRMGDFISFELSQEIDINPKGRLITLWDGNTIIDLTIL